MAQSLIVKDGNGNIKSLQVDSGSNGYISNHTLVSTVTGSNINLYYPYSGWDWDTEITVSAASLDSLRKGMLIANNSSDAKCYVLVGSSDFGTISDLEKAPPKYSFLLEGGATYFADSMTCALEHNFFVVSASHLTDSDAVTISVTEIY